MLEKYLNPPQEIKDVLQDLFLYFQIQNPVDPEAFVKMRDSGGFSGDIQSLFRTEALVDIDSQRGKPWEYLADSLFYKSEIDNKIKVPDGIQVSQVPEWISIVQKGIVAHLKLTEWMAGIPISYKTVKHLFAKRFDWHIFDVGSVDVKDGPIAIYDEIMDIDDPLSFIEFLRTLKCGPSLFMAIQQKKTYWWRGGFYFFLAVNGRVYTIDNMERRLNQNNTSGCRDPGKYMENNWVYEFLPYNLLIPLDELDDEDKENEWHKARAQALVTNDGRKVRPISKISSYGDSFKAALECFVLRAMWEIKQKTPLAGIAGTEQLLLTTGMPSYSVRRDATKKSDYLVDIYKPSCEALAVPPDRLAMVVDTPEFHAKIVNFAQEKSYADRLQQAVVDDYKQNWESTKTEISAFFDSFKPRKDYFIEKALENRFYTVDRAETPFHKAGAAHLGILASKSRFYGSDGFPLFGTEKNRRWIDPIVGDPECTYCKKCSPKIGFSLVFMDYHQMMEFWEVSEKDLPKNVVLHLHEKAIGTGNSILDDVEPISMVRDPWFSDRAAFDKWAEGDDFHKTKPCDLEEIGMWTWKTRHIVGYFTLCNRCLLKIKTKLAKKGIETPNYREEDITPRFGKETRKKQPPSPDMPFILEAGEEADWHEE